MTEALVETVGLSLRVALVATLAVIPLGLATAWVLARREFRGKVLLDALVGLPLVIPPVVTGYALLLLLGRNGPVGGLIEDLFGASPAFTWFGAAIAAAVMAFPLFVRTARVAVEAVDPALEEAARTLGSSALATFLRVTLPLAGPGLVAGGLLAFARSLGEFGATITLAGNIAGETRTIPLAIYGFTQTPDGRPAALVLVAVSVSISLAAVLLSEILVRSMRRRLSIKSHSGWAQAEISSRLPTALGSSSPSTGSAGDQNFVINLRAHRSSGFNLACDAQIAGSALAVVGASGAGKTTLLRFIAGLANPDHGFIAIGGRTLVDTASGIALAPQDRRIGVVFQEPRLFPHLDVAANIGFGNFGGSNKATLDEPTRIIATLGLADLLDRKSAELSGGQARRVAIARALVSGARVLLLDEPLAGLDAERRRAVIETLVRLRDEFGVLLVCVAHRISELHGIADGLLVLDEGQQVAAGPYPGVLQEPAAFEAVSRLGFENLLDVEVVAVDSGADIVRARVGGHELSLPFADLAVGQKGVVGISPRDVILSAGCPVGLSARNAVEATVTAIARLGRHRVLTVDIGAQVRAEITDSGLEELGLAVGSAVWVVLKTFRFAGADNNAP